MGSLTQKYGGITGILCCGDGGPSTLERYCFASFSIFFACCFPNWGCLVLTLSFSRTFTLCFSYFFL